MKTETVIYIGAAVAGALVLLTLARGRSGGLFNTGEAERMAGVQHLYSTSAAQQAMTDAAIQANWQQLQDSVFKSQPDFWV